MTEKDFDKIEFNPLILVDNELMQERYEYFEKRDIFNEPLSQREVLEGTDSMDAYINGTIQDDKYVLSDLLKYIVLFIDTDSPFWSQSDFSERILNCLKWAKIKKSSRAYFHIAEETFWYQKLMTAYFKYVADGDYEVWLSMETSLRTMNAFLREPFNREDPERSAKAHNDLHNNILKHIAALDKLKSRMFPKDKKVQKKMIQYEDNKESIIGHAEKRAKMLRN